MRRLAWASVLLAGPALAQVADVPVGVTVSDGFGFGARWQVELQADAGAMKIGTKLECRVDAPPDDRPRAEVTCRLPDGRRVHLGEPDGRPGVLPIDVRVRSLRLLLSAGSR
ncbi:MAG: hypothetical protein JNL71_03020 [Rhodospirillales bacterium]|nr:hypothetical protein [Rhodospirillales bacterium]